MTHTIYRPAPPADAETIVEFQIAMAHETEGMALDRAICAAGVRAVFEQPSRGCYYVAHQSGQVVGSLLITYEWSDWRNGVVWWIQSVYVQPTARRQGIYTGLYTYIRDLAEADAQVCGLRLYVDQRNAAAQQVYARLGMNGEHYRVFEWMKDG